MDSFQKFWDKINGKMYKDVPRPVKYDFANYMDAITSSSPLNNCEDGTWELSPISQEDTARYGADDVENWMKNYQKNTTKLGDPMSDEDLRRFMGNPR